MRALLRFVLVLSALAAACSSSSSPADDAGSCPNDLPTSCPSPPPSYKDEVSNTMDLHCTTCHGPGGTAAEKPLLTYDDLFRQRSAVLNQTYGCAMPPAGERPLTPVQRANLLAWLVCGAPNN
jgi:mono/diheme cytochrome c family protein